MQSATTTQLTNAAGGTAVVGGGLVSFLSDNQLLIGLGISLATCLIFGLSKGFDAWMKWRKDKRENGESEMRKRFLERERAKDEFA